MSNAFDRLIPRPSLGEAASFFLKLKTAEEQPMAAPQSQQAAPAQGAPAQGADVTGQQEGPFTAPLEYVIQLMGQMVQNEFKTLFAYKTYAESLRDPAHFAVAQEFNEHAENELEHAEFLMRRMAVLSGGPITLPNIPPPPPLADIASILQTMIEMEQTGIANWRALLAVLGDNPTRYEVEAILTRELEHVDELWQMLPQEQVQDPAVGQTPPAAPTQAAPQTKTGSEKTASVVQMGGKVWGPLGEGHAARLMDLLGRCDGTGKVAAAPLETKTTSKVSLTNTSATAESKTPDGDPMWDSTKTAGTLHRFPSSAEAVRKLRVGRVTRELKGASRSVLTHAAALGAGALLGSHSSKHEKKAAAPTSPHIEKAKMRGEGNLAAKAVKVKGERGEMYGDLIGRILGGAGGWKAGKVLAGKPGETLARVAGTGLAQSLGGRLGKTVGKEIDAAHNKKKLGSTFTAANEAIKTAGVKLGLEEQMNALPMEQQAEQAQIQNEAQFYREKAQTHARAAQEMQQNLQEATQKTQEQEQAIAEMQTAMAANADAASTATTQAMLQAVNANTESIRQRQLASSTTQGLNTLKDQLRQLADGPSGGDTQGPGDPQGGQMGPAGKSTQPQDGPGNAPPAGENNAYQPIESPAAGSAGTDQKPTGQGALASDSRTPSEPSAYKTSSAIDWMAQQAKGMGPKAIGAGVGAVLGGGTAAAEGLRGNGDLDAKSEALKGQPHSFSNAMGQASINMRKAFREAVHEHPIAGAAAGALMGGTMGAGIGAAMPGQAKKLTQDIATLKE